MQYQLTRLATQLRARGPALGRALAIALVVWFAPPAYAEDAPPERLQVVDPYVELHTGPGRGFPIFFVVERNDWIEIESRHTDWFKVRTAAGKEGWVDRAQLENTLTEAGNKKTFRDVLLDDYLRRRLELGAAWGHYASDPMFKLWATYNLTDTLAVEATAGQVEGLYSGTNFWHVNLLVEPWSDRRLEPFFGIGVGRIYNLPNATLISALSTNANMANAMFGIRYHVTDRLIVRLDWAAYTAFLSDSNTQQYRAITAGLSFFF